MSIFRAIGIATAVISGGATLARNELDRRIEKKINAKITEAQERAISALENQIDTVVKAQLLNFTRNLAFKACFIAILFAGYFAGIYDDAATTIIIALALALFLIRDLWSLYPTAKQVFLLAKRHDWNLFQAIREMVAASVFDQAYEEVMEQTQDSKVKYWIALSRYSHEDISEQIADAISKVASNASVPIVRTRAGLAIGRAAIMMIAYSLALAGAMFLI